MHYIFLVALVILTPHLAAAQTGSLQGLIKGSLGFIDAVLIPLVLGIAFLFVVWNGVRFFVIGGDNEESQENAKRLALYSVAAFVLILSFWGIVSTITNGIGLGDDPCMSMPDYIDPSGTTCPQPGDVSANNPDFGNDIGGFPAQPGVDLPGNLPAPDPMVPPVTFTPDGQDFSYTAVRTLADQARAAAARYLLTELDDIVGTNVTQATADLFSDLTHATTSVSERTRIISMLRLERLGELPTGTAQTYYTTVLNYQQDAGIPATAQISNYNNMVTESTRPVPLPRVAVNKTTATNQSINNYISTYHTNMAGQPLATPAEQQTMMNRLYDTSATPAARLAYLDNLIATIADDSNSLEALIGANLRTSFIEDINTQLLYQGQSNFLN